MLFNIPKREPDNVSKIIEKVQETAEFKPVLKVKNGTVLNTLELIKANVEKNLGTYHCLLLNSDEAWLDYCRNVDKNTIVSLDTETSGLTFKDQVEGVAGVCIKSLNQTEAYAPIGHISTITDDYYPNQVSKEAIKQGFDILNKHGSKYIFHNAYYDLVVLKGLLGYFVPVYWDTMVASFLLNENEPHGLKYLYDKYVMKGKAGVHKFAELFDGIPFNYIPPNIGCKYSAHDSKMTESLYLFQKPFLTKGTSECTEYKLEGVCDVFYTEELPLIPVLADMYWRGIHVDLNKVNELIEKYTKLRDKAKKEFDMVISTLREEILFRAKNNGDIEYPVNYNSPAQIKVLIYEILKSGVIFKKEPTGTGKHVLDTVLNEAKYKGTILFDIVKALVEVKKYDKAINTFLYKVRDLALADPNHVVRPGFNACTARTGRLSSSGAINIQQIPSKLGDIRTMFTAGEDRVFVGVDYSREEVAVCAAVCGDVGLLNSFRDGTDIYSHVASLAYNIPYEDCCEFYPDGSTNHEGKTRRSSAKAVVLGILYSKSVRAIGEDLHISAEKAQEVYDSIMSAFPTLAKWIKDTQELATKQGYIDGYYGRRRRLPDLLLPDFEVIVPNPPNEHVEEYYKEKYTQQMRGANFKQRDKIVQMARAEGVIVKDNNGSKAKASREIVNSVIQGSSADICKIALILIHNDPVLKKLDARLEMSIHDEQLLTCPRQNAYEVVERFCYLAVKAGEKLPIKLLVDTEISTHWYGESLIFNENKELVYRQ